MPTTTRVDIPPAEQARRLTELRRARYGYLLALHLLLLCAAGRTPSEVAAILFCSRSIVYRVVRAYRAGTLLFDDPTEEDTRRRRLRSLTPSLKRSVVALLKTAPRVYGWCRTRWSGATRAAPLQLQRGTVVSSSALRRWVARAGLGVETGAGGGARQGPAARV